MVVRSEMAAGTWLAGVVALSSASTVAKTKMSSPSSVLSREEIRGLPGPCWAVLMGWSWAAPRASDGGLLRPGAASLLFSILISILNFQYSFSKSYYVFPIQLLF
jgi:hypothetical protein